MPKKIPHEVMIEAYLRNEVKKRGGIAYKFTSPNRRNVPDRMCLMPNKIIWFIEVKAPGKEPTEAQWREMKRIEALGFTALWLSSREEVDWIMEMYDEGTKRDASISEGGGGRDSESIIVSPVDGRGYRKDRRDPDGPDGAA